MTLQQIRYAVMLANANSMNEAAKKLFISQPSLSEAIKELEKEMNLTIFSRTSKGVAVTAEGEDFLIYARQILGQVELMEEKYLTGKSVKKKFGVSTQHYSFAVKAFVDMVKGFDINEYDFAIRECTTADLISHVRSGKSEIGILYLDEFNEKVLNKLFREYQLEFHELFQRHGYVYLWKEHPLAGKEIITLDDLEEYPCLSFEQGDSNSFYFAEEILSTYDYKKTIKACDRAAMKELMVGLFAYTLSSGIICEAQNDTDFRAIPLDAEVIMRIGYITKKHSVLSGIGKMYIEELGKNIRIYTE